MNLRARQGFQVYWELLPGTQSQKFSLGNGSQGSRPLCSLCVSPLVQPSHSHATPVSAGPWVPARPDPGRTPRRATGRVWAAADLEACAVTALRGPVGPTPPRRPAEPSTGRAGAGGRAGSVRGAAAPRLRGAAGRAMWAPGCPPGPAGWDRRRVGARLRAALAGLHELQGLRATQQARVRDALAMQPAAPGGPRGPELRLEAALAALQEQLVSARGDAGLEAAAPARRCGRGQGRPLACKWGAVWG